MHKLSVIKLPILEKSQYWWEAIQVFYEEGCVCQNMLFCLACTLRSIAFFRQAVLTPSRRLRLAITSNMRKLSVIKLPILEKSRYWWEAILKTWRDYLKVTTIPGLQNVHNASGWLASCIWTFLFVVGFACTVKDVYTNTAEYLAYPVITSMTMDQVVAIQFPSVTVCNLNRIHCANLRKLVAEHWGSELGVRLLKLHDLSNCHLDYSWKPESTRDNERKTSSRTSRTRRQDDFTTIAEYTSPSPKVFQFIFNFSLL